MKENKTLWCFTVCRIQKIFFLFFYISSSGDEIRFNDKN
ncbi:hypothetical protein D083_2359 [Dickeya solani RNS 08.23.3.1.A]|nr:hypothetical protein D083_2359 [Dickeya solani RNS 08.23.3.1.A]